MIITFNKANNTIFLIVEGLTLMMFSWLKTLLKMLFKPAIESSLRYHLSHYFVFFSIPIDVEDKLVGILDYLTDYKVPLDGFNIQ